jgi:hypothetical protein
VLVVGACTSVSEIALRWGKQCPEHWLAATSSTGDAACEWLWPGAGPLPVGFCLDFHGPPLCLDVWLVFAVTGEYWSDPVTGLNDSLLITVLELCFLERLGARSTG